ncbi:nucleoside-diphosphate kinase [Candidatus Woesearchaeota archaeon]|nr:nucleoside-diphosphate kinase [Candidatus Woesearchaeota archaeon]
MSTVEQTLILAKPDAVQRGLAGEIIKRFERVGMKIAGIKMIHATEEQLGQHYKDDKDWKISVGKKTLAAAKSKGIEMTETEEQIGDRIRKWNMETLKFCPIIAIIFEGHHAVEFGRKLVGNTEPRQSPPGTIRGDYSIESYQIADSRKRVTLNLVHASESKKEAEREIKIWFNENEIYNYDLKIWEIVHR